MITFNMTADCEFKAENIADAFKQLSRHFTCLEDENCESDLIIGGVINIQPLEFTGEQLCLILEIQEGNTLGDTFWGTCNGIG